MSSTDESDDTTKRTNHGCPGKVYYICRQPGSEKCMQKIFQKFGIRDALALPGDCDLKHDDVIFGFQRGTQRDFIAIKTFGNELDKKCPKRKDVSHIILVCFMEDNRTDHTDKCYFKAQCSDGNVSFHEIHCNRDSGIIECARYEEFKQYLEEKEIVTTQEIKPDPNLDINHETLRQEIKQIVSTLAKHNTDKTYRIIVCSEDSDGKSSLINNILSALNNRFIQVASTGKDPKHVTKKYLEYKMTINDQDETRFVLCDTRRPEYSSDCDCLLSAVNGKFKTGDDMNNDGKASNKDCPSKRSTTVDEQRACKQSAVAILFVISAETLGRDKFPVSDRFKTIIRLYKFANPKGIPVAFFITKCDIVDCVVKNNITFLYKSKVIEEARNSMLVSCKDFPRDRIFPIVNYTNHMEVTPGMMLPTLNAMKHVMTDIKYHLENISCLKQLNIEE